MLPAHRFTAAPHCPLHSPHLASCHWRTPSPTWPPPAPPRPLALRRRRRPLSRSGQLLLARWWWADWPSLLAWRFTAQRPRLLPLLEGWATPAPPLRSGQAVPPPQLAPKSWLRRSLAQGMPRRGPAPPPTQRTSAMWWCGTSTSGTAARLWRAPAASSWAWAARRAPGRPPSPTSSRSAWARPASSCPCLPTATTSRCPRAQTPPSGTLTSQMPLTTSCWRSTWP